MPDLCPHEGYLSYNLWRPLIVKSPFTSATSTYDRSFRLIPVPFDDYTPLFLSAPSRKHTVQQLILLPCLRLIAMSSHGQSTQKVGATLLEGNFTTGSRTSLRRKGQRIQ